MLLVGKVALVTGAGKGIGEAIAKALIAEKLRVGVNALHAETAAAVAKAISDSGGEAIAIPGNVTKQNAVNAMVAILEQTYGPVDVLVNNAAAMAQMMAFHKTTIKEQEDELATLIGVFNCTRAVLPSMIKRRMGRIINISSVSGRYGMPGRAIYSAAKAGINFFTRALASEVGQFGITVNSVSPGATLTPRFKSRSKEIHEATQRMIAIPRFAEPEEIAQAVLFFLKEESSYITGAALDVDGGFSGYEPYKN